MLYRSHPKIDFKPSALGFGCMRLPVIDGDFSRIDDEKAIPMVRWAIDHGVNYLDTAWFYHKGQSERFVARVIKDGYRDKVKLADKFPIWEPMENWDDCDKIFEEQCARLEVDHIDFYLFHAFNKGLWEKAKKLDLINWGKKLKAEGKISWLGFSFHDELPLFKEIIDAHDWDFCQIQYNYMDMKYQAGHEGLHYAHDHNIAVIIMEPLRGGDIVGEMPDDVNEIFASAPVQRTPAEWALRWLWDQEAVWLVLSGMNRITDVIENVSVAANSPVGCMTEAEYDVLERVFKVIIERKPVGCTGCRYCMPCPQGLDIPRLLGVLNEWRMFNNRQKMGFALPMFPEGHRASDCTACGVCMEKCPQHLQIPELMRELAVVADELGFWKPKEQK